MKQSSIISKYYLKYTNKLKKEEISDRQKNSNIQS